MIIHTNHFGRKQEDLFKCCLSLSTDGWMDGWVTGRVSEERAGGFTFVVF